MDARAHADVVLTMWAILATAVIAVHPSDGVPDVPPNSRIAVEYEHASNAPSALPGHFTVAVNGTSRAGTIVRVGEFAIGGQGLVVHGRYLDVFTPQAPFAAGDTVVVTLSTASFPSRAATAFEVGSEIDTTPPGGGEVVEAEAVESFCNDDDDPGDVDCFSYQATFVPALDAEGPAFLLLDVTYGSTTGAPLEAPFLVVDASFGQSGIEAPDDDRLRLATQVEDLAGNRGPLAETFVPLPDFGSGGGCRCSVDATAPQPKALLLMVIAALIARWIRWRTAPHGHGAA